MLSTLEEVEKAIQALPDDQLKQFRAWYEKFDHDVWDKQIQEQTAGGQLAALAQAAIADHKAGRSKKL